MEHDALELNFASEALNTKITNLTLTDRLPE